MGASWSWRSPPGLTSLFIWSESEESPDRGWGFLGQLSWPTSCHHNRHFLLRWIQVRTVWVQKTIWVERVRLETHANDCIPGGNNLGSQFRPASQRKLKKAEKTSWETYLVFHRTLHTKTQHVDESKSFHHFCSACILGQGQMLLEKGKFAQYSDHERKLRWKQETLFRLTITRLR